MRKSTETTRRGLLRTAAALAIAGVFGLTSDDIAQAQERVLTISNPYAPVSLDPARSAYGRGGTFLLPLYEPLVRRTAEGELEPALAQSWEVSPDSKSATFTLREGVKFSDGEPVTAEAAKRSITYWAGAKGPLSSNLSTLESIDVLDERRFKVNLSQPNPAMVALFDAYWLAGNLISPKGLDDLEGLLTKPAGAGRYILDTSKTISGKTYHYIPNPNYYDKSRINWDRIVISVFEDANSAIQAVQAGQLKIMVADASTGNAAKNSLPDTVRFVHSPLQIASLFLMDRGGETTAALKDLRVRQAINHAMDRKLINQALFGELGEPTAQMQARGFMGYNPPSEEAYPYDIEKAKTLLAEAGFPDGFEMKVGYVNNTQNDLLFNALSGQLSEVGILVKAFPYVSLAQQQESFKKKEVDSYIGTTTANVPNLVSKSIFDVNGVFNPFNAEDPEFTKLIQTAAALPMDKAEDAWKAVYAKAVEMAWFAPVATTHLTYFVSKEVDLPSPGATAIADLTNAKPAQ